MIFQKFMTKNNNISITPIDNNEFNSNENWHPKEGVFFHNFKDKIKNKSIQLDVKIFFATFFNSYRTALYLKFESEINQIIKQEI